MITIEDVLETMGKKLAETYHIKSPGSTAQTKLSIDSPWDRKFISDLSYKTADSKSLSTKQIDIVIKLINRYKEFIVQAGVDRDNLEKLIAVPLYRREPYQSIERPREVRYAGNRRLLFRSKFNSIVNEDLQKLRTKDITNNDECPYFNKDAGVWVVEVFEDNLDRIMHMIKRHKFAFDDEVTNFLMECENGKKKAPKIELSDGKIKVTVTNDSLFTSWLETEMAQKELQDV